MDPNLIVAPNLNGLMYRNHMPSKNIINSFLDFIDIAKEGYMLLGSTNLNGRFWDSSICYFNKYSDKLHVEEIDANIYLHGGITDGKFLNYDKKIIISHDSGDMNILDFADEELKIVEKYTNKIHEHRITELSLWPSCKHFVTSCADASIRIWEVTESNLSALQYYDEAHYNIVSSVSTNPNDNNLFASCSYDKTAILWDKRSEAIGKVIYGNEFCALTKIEWHPLNSHILAVTTSSGDIYLIDTREPEKFISKNSCFLRNIHNVRFNRSGLLAVCADDTKVKVFDTTNEDLKLLYVDDRHNDFVRGLAWSDDTLISCGWDQKVFIHCPQTMIS